MALEVDMVATTPGPALERLAALRHLALELDRTGRSPAYFCRSRLRSIGAAEIAAVCGELLRGDGATVRLNLHDAVTDPVQEMVVFHRRLGQPAPVHRHLRHGESYQILSGTLRVRLFDVEGRLADEVVLGLEDRAHRICRVPAGVWHSTQPLTEVAVFKETRPGPFDPADTQIARFGPDQRG